MRNAKRKLIKNHNQNTAVVGIQTLQRLHPFLSNAVNT